MKSVNLALSAARKRQSLETGFVHHSYENPNSRDTIPLFENFCLVLSLFKTRMADHILEGKAILTKLLSFQVEGHFPIYLHEYPLCRDLKLGGRLYPIIFWLLKDFSQVLGDSLREKLEHTLSLLSKPSSKDPSSPEEWAEFLILAQIEGASLEPAFQKWHPTLCTFLGPQRQEGFEPAITLYDLFMGELSGTFSKRALQDHPTHLRASLIQSGSFEFNKTLPNICKLPLPLTILWGNQEKLHTLILDTKHTLQDNTLYLEESLVEDEIELAFFLSAHPENTILVNGQKSSTFQLGDTLEIFSQNRQFTLKLTTISGEGRFFGHIFKANRPGQLYAKKDVFEGYDWKISLRTLKRTGSCQIEIKLTHGELGYPLQGPSHASHCQHRQSCQ